MKTHEIRDYQHIHSCSMEEAKQALLNTRRLKVLWQLKNRINNMKNLSEAKNILLAIVKLL